MKLFSKRNSRRSPYDDSFRYGYHTNDRKLELVSSEIRNRVVSEIKFLTSSDDFLEWFILFENRKKEKIFFDKSKIDNFSLAELGYRMSDYFELEDFKIIKQEKILQRMQSKVEKFEFLDDYKLFDLAEIVILFAKESKRVEIINRFNAIFTEEEADFQIVEHLITKKSGETIGTLIGLLKDDNLKNKIKKFQDLIEDDDYLNAAKISADIVNLIFSGYIKNNKPQDISLIKGRLSQKILKSTAKKEEKSIRFLQYIDDLLKTSKNLSNDIYDIRHTEKSTIQVTNDNLYKLIANHNMAIVELVLTTLKDDYVLGDNWEKIKSDYLEKYKIDKGTRHIIEKPNSEDIPF